MKKILLFLLGYCLFCNPLLAQTPVDLTVGKIDPTSMGHPSGKSSITPPTVYIEDYTLTFEVDHPDYILYLKDEDGDVVYTTTVYSAQTQLVLPSTLSGDYEVELVMGNWLFTGWINL